MKEEIDIIEKLKDFPKGIKFYSLVYGEVKFVGLTEDRIICETPISKLRHSYNRFGQLVLENETLSSEQILQPNKRGDSWKSHKPDGNLKFKIGYVIVPKGEGDFPVPWKIVSLDDNYYVCDKGLLPFSKEEEWRWYKFYRGAWVILRHSPNKVHKISEISEDRITYKLEGDSKTYSTLDGGIRYWEPTDAEKGDLLLAIIPKSSYSCERFYTIFCGIDEDGNVVGLGKFHNYDPQKNYCLDRITFSQPNIEFEPTKEEDERWLLKIFTYLGIAPDTNNLDRFFRTIKFDISTLKPFDKVLVKKSDQDVWRAELFSHMEEDKYCHVNRYRCASCSDTVFVKCVPYNSDTKHLVGTNLEAPDYYINWL